MGIYELPPITSKEKVQGKRAPRSSPFQLFCQFIFVGFKKVALKSFLPQNIKMASLYLNAWDENGLLSPDQLPDDLKAVFVSPEFLEKLEMLPVEERPDFSGLPVPVVLIGASGLPEKELIRRGIDIVLEKFSLVAPALDHLDYYKRYKKRIQKNPVIRKKQYTYRALSKRFMDVFLSLCILLFLMPLIVIIAVSIRLESRGPVIYSSRRIGEGFRVFRFLKFRSMYDGADSSLSKLQHLNQYQNGKDRPGAFIKIKNDPRITRVGRFIRMTSLDELPQLINVLKGEMSIVGNRPLPIYEAVQLTYDGAARRFDAPAGITGLWQVTKRGKDEMSEQERIALDVKYAENRSFWGDISILFRTLPAMRQHEVV